MLNSMYDSLPVFFMVLNDDRRISFINEMMLNTLGVDSREVVYGKRPGEALGCESSCLNPGGCGCSVHCPRCGAFQAIMEALNGKRSTHECRFRNTDGVSYDYRVWASPLRHKNKPYVSLSMLDIASEKRREALERTFFQDLASTAAGIDNLMDAVSERSGGVGFEPSTLRRVKQCVSVLVDEISFTRYLYMAEAGTLVPEAKSFPIGEIFDRVGMRLDSLLEPPMLSGSRINAIRSDCSLISDWNILFHVLISLARNALEADAAAKCNGEKVRLSVAPNSEGALFEVHNNVPIEPEKQNEIFKRSFSTKGKGRGLGTYSAKLLTERYLHGRIWFSSEYGSGTSFFVQIPNLPAK